MLFFHEVSALLALILLPNLVQALFYCNYCCWCYGWYHYYVLMIVIYIMLLLASGVALCPPTCLAFHTTACVHCRHD